MTGGEAFYYSAFDSLRDGDRFIGDIDYLIRRNFGYEAVMRMRCSSGKYSLFMHRW
jgi:protein transport protein SEC24